MQKPAILQAFLILFSDVDVRVDVQPPNRSFPENEKSPEILRFRGFVRMTGIEPARFPARS